MSGFFIKLLNMSIAACWLILPVILVRLVLRKAPKWIRLILWAMVAVRLVCPVTLESALSLVPSAETVHVEAYRGTPDYPQVSIQSGFEQVDAAFNPVYTQSTLVTSPFKATPADAISFAAYVWLTGIACMLLYALISYLLLKRKVRTSLHKGSQIYVCDDIPSPFILGFFRPRIYLPSGMDGQTAQYVVSHEQGHIRRMDHLWKPLGFLVLSIHWFNPLVWACYVLFCRDIEYACDEKVIRALDNDSRADYSQALLDCSISRKAISPCPLAFGETGVKDRIKKVLHYKKPALWIIIASITVCTAVAVFLLTDPKQQLTIVNPPVVIVNPPGVDDTDSLYISNSFYIDETPPFPLPDFELDSNQNQGHNLYYRKITPQALDRYCQKLVQEGFILTEMIYSRFLYRSDCVINIHYSTQTKSACLEYYAQRTNLPANAQTPQQAQALIRQAIKPDHDLYMPIDITPEGLFERTGGQVFLQPIHSYDVLQDGLCIPENESYYCCYFFVTATGAVYINGYESIAVTDLDENGIDEIWTLQYGPTSGLFTFYPTAWENGEIKYQNIFTMRYLGLSFSQKDGRLCLHGVGQYDKTDIHDFDISIVDGNIVITGSDGQPFDYWGYTGS